MSRSRTGESRACGTASANLILPLYMRRRVSAQGAETRGALVNVKKKKKKMRSSNQTENATNRRTRNYEELSFAARFSNQRALINRAIRQVTCERWAYPLSSGRVRLSLLRALAWNAHLCTYWRLIGVDVLKITLVRYLDSLSYPSFRPICTMDTPRPRA